MGGRREFCGFCECFGGLCGGMTEGEGREDGSPEERPAEEAWYG